MTKKISNTSTQKKVNCIPPLHKELNKISKSLVQNKALAALFLDCSEFSLFQQWYGKKILFRNNGANQYNPFQDERPANPIG